VDKLKVALDLPRDLLGALDVPPAQLEARLRELIALELFREGRISSGKGAELLGISKIRFIQLLGHHRLDYFTQTPEELTSDVTAAEELLDEAD
jgi:predicted HTH domain antitoxin